MRTVVGPSDRVVVIGAGLAGLTAAMHLTAAGRRVTVIEASSSPGGRAGRLVLPGPGGDHVFDTGPTVLTMPEILARPFEALGERLDDHVRLRPVEPAYAVRFADGSRLRVLADTDAMADEVRAFAGEADAQGYRRWVSLVTRMYAAERSSFIDRQMDSPLGLVGPDLARLAALGGFRRLHRVVGSLMTDERLRRAFSFQALYAGLSPYDALGLYAVIGYMDAVRGVSFTVGGLHEIPLAMAAVLRAHGGELRLGVRATRLERHGGRVTAVHVEHAGGAERLETDAVVCTVDPPTAYATLLDPDDGPLPGRLARQARRPARQRFSPSCWLMLAGTDEDAEERAHHTLHLGHAWREVFTDLAAGRLMSDPAFLVSRPSVTDPSLAPAGRHLYYVLFPTPNLQAGPGLDWSPGSALRERYRRAVGEALAARGLTALETPGEVEHVTTPHEWAAQGMAAGTPFAGSHLMRQTGPFRPANLWGENLVLAGSGTVPGVGVPMVIISGRLAAERITGPVVAGTSRAAGTGPGMPGSGRIVR